MGNIEVDYPSQTTDPYGFFTVPVGTLPNGVYDIRVKGPDGGQGGNTLPGFLANSGSVTLTGEPTTDVEFGLMRAGDANNDNVVNSVDFDIFLNSFDESLGDPDYDNRVDFNGDNVVTSIDFTLLNRNFGASGAPPIRPGGP